jgi:RNA polymerase sigma-70 factor (ECF subfamily)
MHDRAVPFAGLSLAVAGPMTGELDAILTESSRLAFRVAYSVLRQRETAEDVAQEALVRACRRFSQLRDPSRFRPWLVRLTWRLAIDEQRAARRRSVRERLVVPALAESGPPAEEVAALWAAIDRLPDRLRWPLILSAIDGHDLKDVAQLLQVPEGTIKSRLFAARRQLRELLQ